MITGKARSRPHTQEGGSNNTHGHDHMTSSPATTDTAQVQVRSAGSMISTAPDLADQLEQAARLVRLLADQERAERAAYGRGWRDAGDALAYAAAEAWEAGYAAAEADADARWAEVAARSHYLGGPESRTYAEARAAELEACKPRPGDFPGLEKDPRALDRYRASVESMAQPLRRAA